jgi:hypothetical protein
MNMADFFKRWDADTSLPITDFNGIWRNELDSEMEISVGEHGRVTGIYRSAEADENCRGEHELVGFANENMITFSVDFEHNHILTSWTGHFVNDGGVDEIKTLWHLVKSVQEHDLPLEAWGSVYTGSNVFKRV